MSDDNLKKDKKQINETIRQINIDLKDLQLQYNRAKLQLDVHSNLMTQLEKQKKGETVY